MKREGNMKVPWSRLIVLALLTCNSAHPDTITMKDNVTINGALVGMSNGVLRVRVRFPSETKEVWIKAEEVQSIEFNLLTLNAGAPPKLLGFGPPSDQSPPQTNPSAEGVIVFRGGTRHSCVLVGIDPNRVHCDPKDAGYDRNTVLRILLGSK